MVSLAGFEPATVCLEDRRSDSAELQALETGPKSVKVQSPLNQDNVKLWTLDLRLGPETWDLNWSGREASIVGLCKLHAP